MSRRHQRRSNASSVSHTHAMRGRARHRPEPASIREARGGNMAPFRIQATALASTNLMAKRPDIELVALTKRYGNTVAFGDINLKIPAGSYNRESGPYFSL